MNTSFSSAYFTAVEYFKKPGSLFIKNTRRVKLEGKTSFTKQKRTCLQMTFENKMTRNLSLQTRDLNSSLPHYMMKFKYKMDLESKRQVIF